MIRPRPSVPPVDPKLVRTAPRAPLRSQARRALRPRAEVLEDRLVLPRLVETPCGDRGLADRATGEDKFGNISLRSAIQATIIKKGDQTIVLPAGTYKLTLRGF